MIELQLLLATFSAWANRRQGSVIAYLVEENRVLKEQLESGGRREVSENSNALERHDFPLGCHRPRGPVRTWDEKANPRVGYVVAVGNGGRLPEN